MKNPHTAVSEWKAPVVLVTGATGFLGGALLERLIGRDTLRLIALGRGKSGATATERVLRSINRFGLHPLQRVPPNLQIIEADLSNLDVQSRSVDLGTVTHVIHCAANTSFRSKRGVWETNYEGTRALLSVCEHMPQLERLVYVGTAMACGERSAGLVYEFDELLPGASHVVEYTRSKAATESEILNQSHLPIVVVRPSIIVGHTTLGVVPSASIWWFFRTVASLRFHFWRPDTLIDVVPVDWAASALETLITKQHLRFREYHISAGLERACSWSSIDCEFNAEQRLKFASIGDLAVIRENARLLFPGVEAVRLADALSAYYRFAAMGVVFDNSRILAEGVALPPSFTSLIRHYIASDPDRSAEAQMRDDD